jgi:hypothetical protein
MERGYVEPTANGGRDNVKANRATNREPLRRAATRPRSTRDRRPRSGTAADSRAASSRALRKIRFRLVSNLKAWAVIANLPLRSERIVRPSSLARVPARVIAASILCARCSNEDPHGWSPCRANPHPLSFRRLNPFSPDATTAPTSTSARAPTRRRRRHRRCCEAVTRTQMVFATNEPSARDAGV